MVLTVRLLPCLSEMQGGFGSFSALPSLTVLQEEILWFWPRDPVLHQWELGLVASRRGIDVSLFKHHDEMMWNAARPFCVPDSKPL